MEPSPSLPPEKTPLQGFFVRYEENFAVFSNDILGEFRWPVQHLPETLKIGDRISFKILTSMMEDNEKYACMRKLLEELIN